VNDRGPKFSEKEDGALDRYLDVILSEHKSGRLTSDEAHITLAQLVTQVRRGEGDDLRYMEAMIASRGKNI
jgi:hypothetical protein